MLPFFHMSHLNEFYFSNKISLNYSQFQFAEKSLFVFNCLIHKSNILLISASCKWHIVHIIIISIVFYFFVRKSLAHYNIKLLVILFVNFWACGYSWPMHHSWSIQWMCIEFSPKSKGFFTSFFWTLVGFVFYLFLLK